MRILGKYFLFLFKLVHHMEKFNVYVTRVFDEGVKLGTSSIVIVTIVSTFIGAVTCVQTAFNLVSPFIQDSVIATVVRDMTILELAPTILSVVLAGKVGSNIAGELGAMRISEQVDALEVMGINSASYLVLPKIIAALITFPALVILAAFLGIGGGMIAGVLANVISVQDYQQGLLASFNPFTITFAMTKAFVFAFLITSISAYKGYHTQGGALEVGKSSTSAVTNSCIAVLFADYILADIML
jgi:phospholipid/cholesterol/gamma-HCH transport system permease protein